MTLPVQRRPKPTALYRHYDTCGCLLYIGITYDPGARARDHKSNSWWAKWSARVVVEPVEYHSRAEAEAEERAAIERERPIFNRVHTQGFHDDLVRYLVEHKHWEHVTVPLKPNLTEPEKRDEIARQAARGAYINLGVVEVPPPHAVNWNDPTPRRFIDQTLVTKYGCWRWRGAMRDGGYGEFRYLDTKLAHRASHLLFLGPIPDGHDVVQTCQVKTCVNPGHLATRPTSERKPGAVRRPAEPEDPGPDRARETCRRNHPRKPPRIVQLASGRVRCRECHNAGARRRRSA